MNTEPVEKVLEQMNGAQMILSLVRSLGGSGNPHTAAHLATIDTAARQIEASCKVRLDGLMQAINKANVTIGTAPEVRGE